MEPPERWRQLHITQALLPEDSGLEKAQREALVSIVRNRIVLGYQTVPQPTNTEEPIKYETARLVAGNAEPFGVQLMPAQPGAVCYYKIGNPGSIEDHIIEPRGLSVWLDGIRFQFANERSASSEELW